MSITFDEWDWKRVHMIQDPVYSSHLDKETFFEIYLPLLENLDAKNSRCYMDTYFMYSPLNRTSLIFVDGNVQDEFRVLAEQLDLIPPIVEICEGESEGDKTRRKKKERAPAPSVEEKSRLREQQIQKTIMKLCESLQSETDVEVRDRINKKIQRLRDSIKESVTV